MRYTARRRRHDYTTEILESRRMLAPIVSGERVLGSIAVLGEVDTFTFAANAHDSIAAAVGDLSGTSFFPQIQVFAPDNSLLTVSSGQTGAGVDLTNVVQTGTYTIAVSHPGGTMTGNYALSMFRSPATQIVDADSASLVSGQRVTGTIDLGDLDVYTFAAAAHESLSMAVGDLSGTSFFPEIQVFAPDGAVLDSVAGQVGTGLDLTNLVQSGTYYVVVRMAGDNISGNYALTMFRSTGGQTVDADSGAITSGQRRLGSIDLGDLDIYTFTAAVGDSLSIAIGDLGNTAFFPQLDLYTPDGRPFGASVSGQVGAGLDRTALTQAGTYVAVLRMAGDSLGGNYAISLFRTPVAQPTDSDSGPISSGQRLLGTIDLGDLDVYTFAASAGDSFSIAVGDVGGTAFFPELDLYTPDGQLFGSAITGQVGTGLDRTSISQSGIYSVVVRMAGDNLTGDYALSLFRTPTAQAVDADSGPISSGERKTGVIDLGDLDIYTFTVNTPSSVALAVGDVSASAFFPQVQLYGPTGAPLGSATGQTGAGLDVTILQSGTCYVVVRMAGDSFNGAYGLTVVQAPALQVVDADSGPLASSQRRTGFIEPGDIDVYTFTANAGEGFSVAVGDIDGSSFFPQIQLFSPSGELLASDVGQSSATADATNVAQTGTYMVTVRHAGDSFTGNYVIDLAQPQPSQTIDPLDGDGGPLLSGQSRTGAITIADKDVFTFNLGSGDNVTINAARLSGSTFNPQIDLFGPAGELIGTNAGATTALLSLTNVRQAGTYYLFVREAADDSVGNYSVALNAAAGTDTRAPVVTQTRFDFDTPRQHVVFSMSESIGNTLAVGDVAVQNVTTGSAVPPANVTASFNVFINEIVLAFPGYANGILPDGNYTATLGAGTVADTASIPLGGAVQFGFFVLSGDATRDRSVNLDDFTVLAANFGLPGRVFSQGNFNYDANGAVNLDDFTMLASQFGKSLAAPSDLPRSAVAIAGWRGAEEVAPGREANSAASGLVMDRSEHRLFSELSL